MSDKRKENNESIQTEYIPNISGHYSGASDGESSKIEIRLPDGKLTKLTKYYLENELLPSIYPLLKRAGYLTSEASYTHNNKKRIAELLWNSFGYVNIKEVSYSGILRDCTEQLGCLLANHSSSGIDRVAFARTFLADGKNHDETEDAIKNLLKIMNGEIIEAQEPILGSWFREMLVKWVFSGDQNRYYSDLEKIRKSAELKNLELPQSERDKNYSESVSKLIDSLRDEQNAAIQIGSLLVVKYTTDEGKGHVVTKVLTTDQLLWLERNLNLFNKPQLLINMLPQIDSSTSGPETSNNEINMPNKKIQPTSFVGG